MPHVYGGQTIHLNFKWMFTLSQMKMHIVKVRPTAASAEYKENMKLRCWNARDKEYGLHLNSHPLGNPCMPWYQHKQVRFLRILLNCCSPFCLFLGLRIDKESRMSFLLYM